MEQAVLIQKGGGAPNAGPTPTPPKLTLGVSPATGGPMEPDGRLAPWTHPTDKDWDVRLVGDHIQIKASVDLKGLRKLVRILKANELLLSTMDEVEKEEQTAQD